MPRRFGFKVRLNSLYSFAWFESSRNSHIVSCWFLHVLVNVYCSWLVDLGHKHDSLTVIFYVGGVDSDLAGREKSSEVIFVTIRRMSTDTNNGAELV